MAAVLSVRYFSYPNWLLLLFNLDITGNWHDNKIPLCKWIDTGSHAVELELISNKVNNFVGIVMMLACVEKKSHGIEFTSRYQWESRMLLESGTCFKARREYPLMS